MKVTFLYHSAFLVETEQVLLAFDCYKGISELPEKKPLYVFISHRHQDHYSREIFKLSENRENVTYVLSDDIPRADVPGELKDSVIFMGPHEKKQVGELLTETLLSTDEGVAFLVTVDGQTLYHAGDLNEWYWAREPEEWNDSMVKGYREEVDLLKSRSLYAAFVVLDGRQEGDYHRGMDYFLKKTGAAHVFPMHCWGDYSVILKYQEEHPDLAGKTVFHEILKEGQQFLL